MMSKEEFLQEDGVYELDGVIWCHLSPIPNWIYLLQGVDFICPFCDAVEKDFIVEKEGKYIRKESHNHGHRCVTFTCKCGQEYGIENYDYYRGD